MKRKVFDRLILMASMYSGYDFINFIEVAEMVFFAVKSTFKNTQNEKHNH